MQTKQTLRRCIHPRIAVLALCICAVGALQAKDDPAEGLRFSSPQVLDSSDSTHKAEGPTIPVTTLAAPDAGRILAAPAIGEDQQSLTFSDDLFGCKTPSTTCSQEHERKLIAAAGASVKRDGRHLAVVPTSGAVLGFVDWKMPTTRTADGDEETHWYLGRLAGSNYHRVEVQFGQDAPGNFLINPATGKTAFVHNGSDVVEPAPDGMHLLTFNRDNPPLGIRVAALDATGPRLQLQCDVGKDGDHVDAHFKGWHDAHGFDIALLIHAANSKLEHRVALRIAQTGAQWSIATPDQAQLAAIGFACRETGGMQGK